MKTRRVAGNLALALVLGAVAWRAFRVAPAPPLEPLPPGFERPVAGLGTVRFGVAGPVRITLFREGAAEGGALRSAEPRLFIDGRDPRPVDGELALDGAVLTAPGPAGAAPLWVVRAPHASLPLVEGAREPLPDTTRPWHLERPVLETTSPAGPVVLECERAALEPDRRVLHGEGAYTLRSGGMSFSGRDLVCELDTGSIRFGDGAPLAWSVPLAAAEGVLSGASDGGGTLRELPGGRRRLVLPARERCELSLPEGSGLPGLFRCSALELELEPVARGTWIPVSSIGRAPSAWAGTLPDGRAASFFGRDAALIWAGEEMVGLDLGGPLIAFLGERARGFEEPLPPLLGGGADGGWLAARGGAWLAAGPHGEHELHGGVGGLLEDGWFEAERFVTGPSGWAAEGGVSLGGGRALADRFERLPDGAQRLSGAVVFQPAPGVAVAAPALEQPRPDLVRATGGVRSHFALRAEPAVLASDELEMRGDLAERATLRVDARHEVEIERGEAVFRGTHFAAHGEDSLELRGSPAAGTMPRRAPDGRVLGEARLRAGRIVLHGGEVIPADDPSLELPAAALGLYGEPLVFRAERMRFADDGASGSLTGGVRGSGGIELAAQSLRWGPPAESSGEATRGPELVLEGEVGGVATVRARLLDREDPALAGPRFDLAARRIRIDAAAERAFLEEDAVMRVREEEGAAPVAFELRGRRAEVADGGGFFRDDATLHQDTAAGGVDGGAEVIEWSHDATSLRLRLHQGRPWLALPIGKAEAAEILYTLPAATADGGAAAAGGEESLELIGSAERPARLALADGRVVAGTRLRYDLRTRLLSGDGGRLEQASDEDGGERH